MPQVSVIIPNYNHALYLDLRISSVLNQTFKDIEVIILDDCSTDNSRGIIKKYAEQDSRISVFFNEQNSGSTFKQWKNGLELAKGKYIWIAESDDYCDLNFLETLLPFFKKHESVGLVYSQSFAIDEQNKILYNYSQWTDDLDAQRWKSDFKNGGQKELRDYFIVKNTIPNASAVLFEKSLLTRTAPIRDDLRLVGDKFFWANLLLVTDVYFCAKPLNYFRHHSNNVRSSLKEGNVLKENFIWYASMFDKVQEIPKLNKIKVRNRLFLWWIGLSHNKFDLLFSSTDIHYVAKQCYENYRLLLFYYYFRIKISNLLRK